MSNLAARSASGAVRSVIVRDGQRHIGRIRFRNVLYSGLRKRVRNQFLPVGILKKVQFSGEDETQTTKEKLYHV